MSTEMWDVTRESFHWLAQGGIETHPEILRENYFGNAPEVSSIQFLFEKSPIQTKLGGVLGIVIARALGLGALPMYYLGRILQLLYCLGLAYAAMRVMPFAKQALGALLMLPMSLHVMASYSYDGPILGLAALLVALTVRAVMGEGKCKTSLLAAMLATGFLIIPCKFAYAVLVLPVFFIPSNRFNSKRQAILFKLSLLVVCLLSVIVFAPSFFSSLASGGGHQLRRRGEEYGYFYTLSNLIGNPLDTCKLFANTVSQFFEGWCTTLVGGSLGWLQPNITAPTIIVIGAYAMLLFSIVPSTCDAEALDGGWRVGYLACFVLGAGAVIAGMAINWAFVQETVVQGIQGRYFLPLLPCLAVALRCRRFKVYFDAPFATLAFCTCLSMANIQVIVAKVLLNG